MGSVKTLWSYLFEKLDIIITPAPRYKVKVFSIRRIVPVIIFVAIILTIGILTGLYKHYHNNYLLLSDKLTTLEGVRKENQSLKDELYALSRETELLRENLTKLREFNKEIKNMIDLSEKDDEEVELKLQTLFSSNYNIFQQTLPMGGGEFHLYYRQPAELIKQTKKNIYLIKKELPEQKKELEKLKDSVREYKNLKAATPDIWPLADKGDSFISSHFGWRIGPISGKQEFHEGLDIGVWYNTPVLATADGIVKFAGWMNGYGWVIIIDHGFGFETRYGHLNRMKVRKGKAVKRGQVIALSGNSGSSTGPHLHYEVRKNNIPQNPLKYIGR